MITKDQNLDEICPKLGKKWRNWFLVSRPSFLAEKREIEKNEKREFLVSVEPLLARDSDGERVAST